MTTKVLWLSPNFNHYKARFLNLLSQDAKIELSVLKGTGRHGYGDKEIKKNWNFKLREVSVSKKNYGFSLKIAKTIKQKFSDFQWVLISAEKKNFPLFILLLFLRFKAKKKGKEVKIISYCHPLIKSVNGKFTKLDILLSKIYFKNLDRVIFYTKQGYNLAIKQNYIKKEKAYWANNTIDTSEVSKFNNYIYPKRDPITILFIGRLIVSKRIPLLLEYYRRLKLELAEANLRLEVIGDGPLLNEVKAAANLDSSIIIHGSVIDESKIAPIMCRSSIVFIPGHSGLSINHAFSYGRPYVTLDGPSQPPEVDYILNAVNGYFLKGSFEENLTTLVKLLTNKEKLQLFCDNAKKQGEFLSVENWVKQIKYALLNE